MDGGVEKRRGQLRSYGISSLSLVVHLRSVERARKVDPTRIPERSHRKNSAVAMALLLTRHREEIEREYDGGIRLAETNDILPRDGRREFD